LARFRGVQIRAAPGPGASLSPAAGAMLLALFDHSRRWHRRAVVESPGRHFVSDRLA